MKNGRGFTLVELLVVISIIALLISILLPALASVQKGAQRAKDQSQLSGLAKSMQVYAAGERDGNFPIPGDLDVNDATVATPPAGESKNTTGAIFSFLLFQQGVEAEVMVSPAESNPDIRVPVVDSDPAQSQYSYEVPRFANEPERALWDPQFRGTPIDADPNGQATNNPAGIGNNSYAHSMVTRASARFRAWNNTTASSRDAVLSNRGPFYQRQGAAGGNSPEDWRLDLARFPALAQFGIDSNTLRIHGPNSEWQGLVAYGDGHVARSDDASATDAEAITAADGRYPDNLFVMERTPSLTIAVDVLAQGVDAYMRPYHRGLPSRDIDVAMTNGWSGTYDPSTNFIWID